MGSLIPIARAILQYGISAARAARRIPPFSLIDKNITPKNIDTGMVLCYDLPVTVIISLFASQVNTLSATISVTWRI